MRFITLLPLMALCSGCTTMLPSAQTDSSTFTSSVPSSSVTSRTLPLAIASDTTWVALASASAWRSRASDSRNAAWRLPSVFHAFIEGRQFHPKQRLMPHYRLTVNLSTVPQHDFPAN